MVSTDSQRSSQQQALQFSNALKSFVVMIVVVDRWVAGRPLFPTYFHSAGASRGLYTFGKSEYSTAAVE
jgi:hypothetical protein